MGPNCMRRAGSGGRFEHGGVCRQPRGVGAAKNLNGLQRHVNAGERALAVTMRRSSISPPLAAGSARWIEALEFVTQTPAHGATAPIQQACGAEQKSGAGAADQCAACMASTNPGREAAASGQRVGARRFIRIERRHDDCITKRYVIEGGFHLDFCRPCPSRSLLDRRRWQAPRQMVLRRSLSMIARLAMANASERPTIAEPRQPLSPAMTILTMTISPMFWRIMHFIWRLPILPSNQTRAISQGPALSLADKR